MKLDALRHQLACASQAVYDDWAQDDDGLDDELGAGGICDRIADAMIGVLAQHGIAATIGGQDGDDHAWVIAKSEDGVVGVDIPYRLYERGAGYSWTRIPGVIFSEDDVEIMVIDPDPAKFPLYVGDDDIDDPEVTHVPPQPM